LNLKVTFYEVPGTCPEIKRGIMAQAGAVGATSKKPTLLAFSFYCP
jgi:hypothetical protein